MHAIFQVRPKHIHKYALHQKFPFENKYQGIVRNALHDWIIYYQPARRAGERAVRATGYFAQARIVSIQPMPDTVGYSEAILEHYFEFPTVSFSTYDPQLHRKLYFEESMLQSDGSLDSHKIQQRVRALSKEEYKKIVSAGFDECCVAEKVHTSPIDYPGFTENPPEELERDRLLMLRSFRDRVFRKVVGEAYDWRCAMTGMSLSDPNGSREVESAHIKPVEHAGPDSVLNGITLSGTVHWLFDKGLLSVGPDFQIIKSPGYTEMIQSQQFHNSKIDRLINESGKITLPKNEAYYPHPDFLRYHRENIFGRSN